MFLKGTFLNATMKTILLISMNLIIIFSACKRSYQSNNHVVPIDRSSFTKGSPQDSISLRWKLIVNRTCTKILNEWWTNNHTNTREGQYIDFGYLERNSKKGEFGEETRGGIRPAAQNAYTIAVALFTAGYDESYLNVDTRTALIRVVTIVKSIAKDHRANGGIDHPWGDQWQSAQWASKTAVAGWLLWDHFDEVDKIYIRNMIEYEANRFLTKSPPSANENYILNTHAEENGWDGTGIQTGLCFITQS